MIRKTVLLFIIVFNSLLMHGQELTIKTWFDSTTIYIGDQINYTFEISCPQGYSVAFPEIKDTLTGGLEIIESTGFDTLVSDEGNNYFRNIYRITSFDTMMYEVPPVMVEAKGEKGILRAYSDYALLEVLRVNIAPPDSTDQIFDIAGPRKAGITLIEILPWVLLLIVLSITGYIVYRFLVGRKRIKPEETSHLPVEPIHIIALRELDKLDRSELWQKGEHKAYYSKLTEILRTYIDRRYKIASMEMTSGETLYALKKSGFNNKNLYTVLSEILLIADLSKFAKFNPDEASNIKSMVDARTFVKDTFKNLADNLQVETHGEEAGNDE